MSIVFGMVAFRQGFRFYSIATAVILMVFAAVALSYVPQVSANQPTSWLGLTERISQYTHQLWHAVLALVLFRNRRAA